MMPTPPPAAFEASILMVGETHGREASYDFFLHLIDKAQTRHHCITVALEIFANEQVDLHRFLTGNASLDEVRLSHVMDNPPYRRFLERLAGKVRSGCVSALTVDAPPSMTGRDKYLARRLTALAHHDTFTLALLGSLHVLGRLDWRHKPDTVDQPAAYWLRQNRVSLFTVIQNWHPGCRGRLRGIEDPEALAAIRRVVSVAKTDVPTPGEARQLADAVVCWEGK